MNKKTISIDVLDIKILKKFYFKSDWIYGAYSITPKNSDFADLGVDYQTIRNRLEKLAKYGWIIKQKTYPIFYLPIQDEKHRQKIEKIYTNFLKEILLKDENV